KLLAASTPLGPSAGPQPGNLNRQTSGVGERVPPGTRLECPRQSTGDAQSPSLLKLLFGNPFAHRLPGRAQQCEDEATRNVAAVVGVLIVDHVAAGSPERISSAEDAWRYTLELEQHLTVDHVTESRTTGKAMGRVARGARWMVDENSQHMGIVGN